MAPAALDARSPLSYSSSLQNPNTDFCAFASDSQYRWTQHHSHKASQPYASDSASASTGSYFVFCSASASRDMRQSVSRSSRRARRRPVKVRKQLRDEIARTSSSSTATFNPFPGSGGCSGVPHSGTENEFSWETSRATTKSGIANVKLSFVFCAKRSDSAGSLSGTDVNEVTLDCSDRGKSETCSGSESSRRIDGLGFVFGANRNDAEANLSWEKRKAPEILKKTVHTGGFKVESEFNAISLNSENASFVFGSKSCKGPEIGLKHGEFKDYEPRVTSSDQSEVKSKSRRKFNADKLKHKSKPRVQNKKFNGKIGSWETCYAGSAFGINHNDFSNPGSSENGIGKVGNRSGFGLVFGSPLFNPIPNLNSKADSVGVFGKVLRSDEKGFHEVHGTTTAYTGVSEGQNEGVFVFGSGAQISGNFEDQTKPQHHGDDMARASVFKPEPKLSDEMQKLNINEERGSKASETSLSFRGNNLQQNGVSEEGSDICVQNYDEGASPGILSRIEGSFAPSRMPQCDPASFKKSLFDELSRGTGFNRKSCLTKEKRFTKMKGKLKQSFQSKEKQRQDMPKESDFLEEIGSPVTYSPMDFSPSDETPLAYCESFNHVCNDSISGSVRNQVQPDGNGAGCTNESSPAQRFSGEPMAASSSSSWNTSPRDECTSSRQPPECTVQFPFARGLENLNSFFFTATATTSSLKKSSLKKHPQKNGSERAYNSSLKNSRSRNAKANLSGQRAYSSGTSSLSSVEQGRKDCKTGDKSEGGAHKEETETTSIFSDACETWRLRGNQAYKNGDLRKAEDYYTKGIESVPPYEDSGSCIRPLVLCYSNRAATRIHLKRVREALGDCERASALDPSFFKVYMRAATCFLVLGDAENAQLYFNKCFESASNVCLDRRAAIEAAEGLEKVKRVSTCSDRAVKFLEQRSHDAATCALEIIAEALSISSCSEKLLQMKAEALILLRRYEEVVKLCEDTLDVAEKNSYPESHDYTDARIWRWHLISKSYFYMGKLEMALDMLQKLKQVMSAGNMHTKGILDSSNSLMTTIHDLLRCKTVGNEAFKGGKYIEAVNHYTAALSRGVESRPFAAICFCNRAAAQQALGQIVDAIADCSLAMALDGNYKKAVSRRTTLHEMIRDYRQAANDLHRLISILEKQSDEKAKTSETPGGCGSSTKELRQARQHLSFMEEEAKREIPLDLYLVLGVKTSDSASDIKKAYRKAALRHHPDKAGHFLVRSEGGEEGQLWKDIEQEVRKDADRLFKMIGEAYAVLSDPTKKLEYDLDEESRKASREINRSRNSRRRQKSDTYSSPFQRTPGAPNWKGNGKTHSNSNPWW